MAVRNIKTIFCSLKKVSIEGNTQKKKPQLWPILKCVNCKLNHNSHEKTSMLPMEI